MSVPMPQTSVTINAQLTADLGDAAEATKLVRKEVKQLEREMTRLLKKGKTVGPELTQKLAQARKLESNLDAARKKQDAINKRFESLQTGQRAIRFFAAAEGLKQIFRGEGLDPRAISQLAFGAAEPIQDITGKLFGPKSKIASFAKSAALIAPIVGEAVARAIEAFDIVARDKRNIRKIALDVLTGKTRADEDALFRRLIDKNQQVFGSDPTQEFRSIQGLVKKIAQLDETRRKKVLDPALKREISESREFGIRRILWDNISDPINREAFQRLLSSNLNLGFDTEFKKRAKELGFDEAGKTLTDKQKDIIRQEIILPSVEQLSPRARTELSERIDLALASFGLQFQNDFANLARLRREASEKFREQELKKRADLNFQRSRQRVALNGRIGD